MREIKGEKREKEVTKKGREREKLETITVLRKLTFVSGAIISS